MLVEDAEPRSLMIELRQQAHYWQAQHGRAVQRETAAKGEVDQLRQIVRDLQARNAELTQQVEALEARAAWLEQQVFGRKSEQTVEDAEGARGKEDGLDASDSSSQRRTRGKQPGDRGYGRKRRDDLPTEEVFHDLRPTERRCPRCGKAFTPFPGTEDSEVIDWEVHLVRRIHRRTRYRPTCNCQAVPGIVAAPGPPKLIPKGMFSVGFWVRLVLEKFLFQKPLYRIRQALALEGLSVSQGTLTGGLRRIAELLQPLYVRTLERNRSARHWHMDETRWMVFADLDGKVGHRWWLWVSVTHDTCVYLLEPSRSAKVPKNHLGENAEGIISADRYSVYKTLGDKILVAFCWSHVRRDFVRVEKGYAKLRTWAQAWITRINELFKLNDQRVKVMSDAQAFAAKDQAVRDAVEAMAEVRDRELDDPTLHEAATKALQSLRNHWEGCILFVDRPEIPMDNNESERRLRNPVLGRKNYYGSGAIWSGMLAAMAFSIIQTLLINGVNPTRFFAAYFETCAANDGQAPENLEELLPWNLSQEQKDVWGYPEPFP
jgi:transposase